MPADRKTLPAFGKVAVLMGGTSAEREVSIETGNAVCAALKRKKVNAHSVDARDAFLGRLLESDLKDKGLVVLRWMGQVAGLFAGQIDAGLLADAEFLRPIDQEPRSDGPGSLKEIHIARLRHRMA